MLLENAAGGLLMGLPGPLICKKAVSVKLCSAKRDKTSVSLWITLVLRAALAATRPVCTLLRPMPGVGLGTKGAC